MNASTSGGLRIDCARQGVRHVTLNSQHNKSGSVTIDIEELNREGVDGGKVKAHDAEVQVAVQVQLQLSLPRNLRKQQLKVSWRCE